MMFERSIVATFLLQATKAAESSPPISSQPHRINFDSLSHPSSHSSFLLLDALSTDGIVSITGIPDGFGDTKRRLMSNLHDCLMDTNGETSGNGDIGSNGVPTQYFRDGTIRRSIATITVPKNGRKGRTGRQAIDDDSLSLSSPSCQNFMKDVDGFRSGVDRAIDAFAERFSMEMGGDLEVPLMLSVSAPPAASSASSNTEDAIVGHGGSESSESRHYGNIHEVVQGGDHLEHFHSYQKRTDSGDVGVTIETHTDQGFFLAFTPGLVVSKSPESLELSDGFYVENAKGERVLMDFDEGDDLVIMMGDGVNRYLNNKLIAGVNGSKRKNIHATPHALTLTPHNNEDQIRVWYGRMVLPPNDGFDPSTKATFGELRQSYIDSSKNKNALPMGIGCSSTDMTAVLTTPTSSLSSPLSLSRRLQEEGETADQCTSDELFCWYRCMPHDAEYEGLTPEVCAEQRLLLQCTNLRDQVVPDGDEHGDWFPGCTNSTTPSAPYPEIDQQDEEVCTDAAWEEFYNDDSYDHIVELTPEGGSETHLMWSITENSTLKARLVHNDVFGWIGFGFANPGGDLNGMKGGNILLAVPGDGFDPVTGLVVEEGYSTGSVDTYVITEEENSAFRVWQDPIATEENDAVVRSFDATGCFMALTFESDHINGKKFDLEGTNDMIWGANSADHFVGYHGPYSRGAITVDWANGALVEAATAEEGAETATAENEDEDTVAENGDEAATAENGDEATATENGDEDGDTAKVDAAEAGSSGSVKGHGFWHAPLALASFIFVYI